MKYSFKGDYPDFLPFRIKLSTGLTVTDPSTFTLEQILDAGYFPVEDPPQINTNQKLIWNRKKWEIVEKTLDDYELEKNNILTEIRRNRNNMIDTIEYRLKINKIQTLLDLPVDDDTKSIEKIDKFIEDLRNMTNIENTTDIVFPILDLPLETANTNKFSPPLNINLDQTSAINRGKETKIRHIRNQKIKETMWRVYRVQSQQRLGLPISEDLKQLMIYIQELADLPKQEGFPENVIWPKDPLYLRNHSGEQN